MTTIRSMVAAQVCGVRRYIMISSINNDVNSRSPIAHYHRAKAHADNHLIETDLDYTIVCPGGLTDEAGTERVAVSAKACLDDGFYDRQVIQPF